MSYPYSNALQPAYSFAPLYSTTSAPIPSSVPYMSTSVPITSHPQSFPYGAPAEALIPMGNLPHWQPNPPAHWTLTKCDTTVKQATSTVAYKHEYTFAAPTPGKFLNQIPAPTRIPTPIVPTGWLIGEEKVTITRKGDTDISYVYDLSYNEKGAAPAAKPAEAPKPATTAAPPAAAPKQQ